MTIDRNMIWQETKDYFNITLGLMLYTFGFTVFLLPYQIVTGGIAGIGAIIFYATKFPVASELKVPSLEKSTLSTSTVAGGEPKVSSVAKDILTTKLGGATEA